MFRAEIPAVFLLLFFLSAHAESASKSEDAKEILALKKKELHLAIHRAPVVCSRPPFPVNRDGEPQEGEATVIVQIGDGGEPISAEISISSGNEVVDRAAITYAMQGIYMKEPGESMEVDYVFELTDF